MGKVIHLFKGEKSMVTVLDIAKTLLSIESMTNKKLQKLCYYAQAWYLTLNSEPLFENDFEAWIHGPVCPELYHHYKKYGHHRIAKTDIPDNIKNDEYVYNFIHNIYDLYGNMSGDDLEFLTHKELPWANARDGLQSWESSKNIITKEDMVKYYSSLYEGK